MKAHLITIDPQRDFVEPSGSLCVAGAAAQIPNLVKFIDKMGSKLEDVHVTLDSHPTRHIAHGVSWIGKDGKNPQPFTIISADDVDNGVWRASIPSLQSWWVDYVHQLSSNGRYPLCIWPEHCIIGTEGQTVVPALREALTRWERNQRAIVDFVTKGSNFRTEHYGAIHADVPDPSDPSTQINTGLVQTLMDADRVYWSGWASSHCLAFTFRDTMKAFNDPALLQKQVLLKDATAPVKGFEQQAVDFENEMVALGMQTALTTDF